MYKKLVFNRTRLSCLIVLVAILVRLIYVLIVLSNRGLEKGYDAGDYIQFANFMHSQGWMVSDISELMLHAGPGYPLILYTDMLITGGDMFYLSVGINILAGALFCLVLFQLLLELGLNVVISSITSFWAVFYVHYIRYASELNKETIVILILLLIVRLLYKQANQLRLKGLVSASLCYGYLIHVDERYFFYLPFLVLFLMIPFEKKSVFNAFVFSIFVVICMIPWLYRNYIVYQRPVVLTERTAKYTDKLFGYDTPVNPFRNDPISPYNRDNLDLYESFTDSLVHHQRITSENYRYLDLMAAGILLGDTPRTQTYFESKLNELKELYKPIHFSGSYTANGYRYHPKWKLISNLVYGTQYGLLLILFPFGIWELYHKSPRFLHLGILLIIVHSVIHVFIAYGLQRYRVPIDFIFLSFAPFGLKKIQSIVGSYR